MSNTPGKVSPIVAIAAGSVIVFSAVGVGVMTGLIPSSFSNVEPQPEPAKAAVTSPAPAAPVAVPAPQAAPKPARAAQPARTEEKPRRAERVAAARACANCGTVKSVNAVEHQGEGTGLGAIGGAVVGGVLGNQIGDGSGRRVATVAGAAAGAYGGHQVEKHVKSSKSWNVVVRMQDGESRTFPFASDPGFRPGDQIRVVDGRLVHRRQGG